MADETPSPVSQSARANSVPALITWWLLGLWTLISVAKFAIVASNHVTIDAQVQGFLSNVESTTQNLLLMAVSFWVGSSVGAKASGDALAQLAGAGPPPPAAPLAAEPDPPADTFRIKP